MKKSEFRHKPLWEKEVEGAGSDLSDTRRGFFRTEQAGTLSAEDCIGLGLISLLENGAITERFNQGGR
jgi:hypothetical protein